VILSNIFFIGKQVLSMNSGILFCYFHELVFLL